MALSLSSTPFMRRALYLLVPTVLILVLLYHVASNELPHAQPGLSRLNSDTDAHRGRPPIFDKFFPSPNVDIHDYRDWNTKELEDLYSCMTLENCGVNQTKVALLADNWFPNAVFNGASGGEGVWMTSIYKHLKKLGYTTLMSTNFEETVQQYRMMPDLVKVVLRDEIWRCYEDSKCLKTKSNPTGIPAWKMFATSYWPNRRLSKDENEKWRMKGKWILSALPDVEEDSPIQFLGFSIEDYCMKMTFIPLHERKNQVWLLMKQLMYIYHKNFPWKKTYFPLVHEKLNINFIGGWRDADNYLDWGNDVVGDKNQIVDIHDPEHGVYNLGVLKPDDFFRSLADTKIMIGVGNPYWSPSPLEGLCLGIPFLNPIYEWDRDDPWNKTHWSTQHPTLQAYDRPYVYNVHKKNYTGFLEAIETATKTPINRYILEFLTEKAMQVRVSRLMETDWLEEGKKQLLENMAKMELGEDAFIFEL